MAILPPLNYNLYAEPYADLAWGNALAGKIVHKPPAMMHIKDIMFLLGLKMINVGIDPETLAITAHNKPENMSVIISAGIKKDENLYYVDYQIDEFDFKNGYVTTETVVDHIFLKIKDIFYPHRDIWTQKLLQKAA